MIASLLLGLLPAVQDGDVEREWRARRWALAPTEAAVGEALASGEWEERFAALEALARGGASARAGLAQHPIAEALDDAHPNVRAAALEVHAAAGVAPPPAALALTDDPFGPVRRALAEALARADTDASGRAALLRLAGGAGEAAEVARRGLLSAGPAAWPEQLALLGDVDALLEGLAHLRRAPVAPELVRALREQQGDPLGRTLVEALALHAELDGADVTCDRALLAEGWLSFRAGDYRHEVTLRERLLETARERDEALAAALLAQAGRLLEEPAPDHVVAIFGDGPAAAAFLAECAAHALGPERTVAVAAGQPEALAAELWAQVLPPLTTLDRAGAARWLAPDVDEELRFGVASVLADHFRATGDVVAEELLVLLLEDADTGLRRAAFRWLADGPEPASRLEVLHAAWDGYPAEEQVLHLRALPRGLEPTPFREGLLTLCADPTRRTSSLLELLGSFEDDAGVREALRSWLEEALVGLEASRTPVEWRAHEARAAALVEALGPGEVQEVAGALGRVLAAPPPLPSGARHDPELSKRCAALLGRTTAGRARLLPHLARGTENRVRIEAGIQLVTAGEPEHARAAAVTALVEGFARCDAELGGRVLRALGRSADPAAAALLDEVVRAGGRGLDLRLTAVDALARQGELARLRAAFTAVGDPEVLSSLAAALARSGDPEAVADLRTRWTAARARAAAPDASAVDLHLAGELLVAVVSAGELPSGERGLVLGGALVRAPQDLTARFRRTRTAATGFRWRAELRACELAAARGELGAWLDESGPYWRLDGDLLLALADAARGAGDVALAYRLVSAAEVATAGEPISDGWWNRRARLAIAGLQLATELGDSAGVEARSATLWGDMRLIDRRIAAREDALGQFDRSAGLDPVANLDAGRLQARAWQALAAGDHGQARACADRAAARIGASLRAREGQALLAAALSR